MKKSQGANRRDFLKSIIALPVLGIYAYGLGKKLSVDERSKEKLIKQFDLGIQTHFVTEEKPAGRVIRIGMIGLGDRGQSLARSLGFPHPAWITQNTQRGKFNNSVQNLFDQYNVNVKITGICDVFDVRAEAGLELAKMRLTPEGIQTTKNRVKRYRNYHEMLESKDIDAVVIATPDHLHAQMAIDAARAGKHIYLEKCMTRTIPETLEIYQTIKNSRVVFQLGHQNRQQASFYIGREIIRKGLVGKITLIEVASNRNTEFGAWSRDIHSKGNERTIDWEQFLGSRPFIAFKKDRFFNWQKYLDYGTGICGQLFSHEFDAVNQMMDLGIPKSVSATGGIYYHKDGRDAPDVFNAIFEYPGKELTLTYNASLANSNNRGKLFMGSDGTLEVGSGLMFHADTDSKRFAKEIENGSINGSKPILAYNPASAKLDAVTSATTRYYEDRGYGYTLRNGKLLNASHLHLKDWLDCIRHGGTPKCDIEKGLEVTITCHMATTAYLEKRRVEWDPVNLRLV